MIYYDFELDGEYESETRALSFITALKEVFADKDSAPTVTNQLRFLMPYNYNGTTLYLGYLVCQVSGSIYVAHSLKSRLFLSGLTSVDEEYNPTSTNLNSGFYTAKLVNSNTYYPKKYMRVYSLDNNSLYMFFTTDTENERDNNINTSNDISTITFCNSNIPVFGNIYYNYSLCYDSSNNQNVKDFSHINTLFEQKLRYNVGNSTSNSNFWNQMIMESVFPEYANSLDEMYVKKAHAVMMVPEIYTYNESYSGYRQKVYDFKSNELIALYTHGAISIQAGYKYNINGSTYIPLAPYINAQTSLSTYNQGISCNYALTVSERNLILMIPVGTDAATAATHNLDAATDNSEE